MTEDTYNGTITDQISQNRYVYAGDDPMRYTDPTGHVMVVPRYTVGGSAATTMTTAPPERTCQQGEVRDCVMPTSTTDPMGSIVKCLGGQCGAILVTGLMVDASVFLTMATTVSAAGNLVDGGITIPVTAGLSALTATSWDATANMAVYDYQYGSSANPVDAVEAGGAAVVDVLNFVLQTLGL